MRFRRGMYGRTRTRACGRAVLLALQPARSRTRNLIADGGSINYLAWFARTTWGSKMQYINTSSASDEPAGTSLRKRNGESKETGTKKRRKTTTASAKREREHLHQPDYLIMKRKQVVNSVAKEVLTHVHRTVPSQLHVEPSFSRKRRLLEITATRQAKIISLHRSI